MSGVMYEFCFTTSKPLVEEVKQKLGVVRLTGTGGVSVWQLRCGDEPGRLSAAFYTTAEGAVG